MWFLYAFWSKYTILRWCLVYNLQLGLSTCPSTLFSKCLNAHCEPDTLLGSGITNKLYVILQIIR